MGVNVVYTENKVWTGQLHVCAIVWIYIKEGVLLRNVRAAPICDHFAVVPPSSWMREPVPFLV